MDSPPENGISAKDTKRANSLIRSSRSSMVICFVGIFIPFLAALSCLIGLGYGLESRKLADEKSGLDHSLYDYLLISLDGYQICIA